MLCVTNAEWVVVVVGGAAPRRAYQKYVEALELPHCPRHQLHLKVDEGDVVEHVDLLLGHDPVIRLHNHSHQEIQHDNIQENLAELVDELEHNDEALWAKDYRSLGIVVLETLEPEFVLGREELTRQVIKHLEELSEEKRHSLDFILRVEANAKYLIQERKGHQPDVHEDEQGNQVDDTGLDEVD